MIRVVVKTEGKSVSHMYGAGDRWDYFTDKDKKTVLRIFQKENIPIAEFISSIVEIVEFI